MILNFLRVAECPLAYMVSSSYSEYHSQKANARDIIAASKLRSTIESIRRSSPAVENATLNAHFTRCQQFWKILADIHQVLLEHDRRSHRLLDDLFVCGRIVRIRDSYEIDVPAMVLDGSFSTSSKVVNPQRMISILVIHRSKTRLLTDVDRVILKENEKFFVVPVQRWKRDETENGENLLYQIKTVHLTDLMDISDEIIPQVKYQDILEGHWNRRMGDDIDIALESTMANDKVLRKTIEQLKTILAKENDRSVAATRFHLLNKIVGASLLDQLRQTNELFETQTFENVDEDFHQLRRLNFYENKLKEMKDRISSIQSNLQQSADYESMLEILKKMNYISRNNLLKLKGQVAAIFGSGKELLLTELIYQNLIDHLTSSEIAALLSAIVFQGKRVDDQSNDQGKRQEMTPALHQAKKQLSESKSIDVRRTKRNFCSF